MQLLVRLFVVLVTLLGVAPVAKGADLVPGEALKHVGERARICGHVSSAKYAQSVRGAPTFLNFGRPYPNQDFTAFGTCCRHFAIANDIGCASGFVIRGFHRKAPCLLFLALSCCFALASQ